MSYNIVKESKSLVLLENTAVDLINMEPTEDVLLKHIQVHVFLKGHLLSDFKMRLNVYNSDGSLMMRSAPVNNLDIARSGDFYCELRFDFPSEGNIFSLYKSHRIEFEVYEGYSQTTDDYLAIMLAPFSELNWLGSGYWEPSWAPELAPRLSIFTDIISPASGEKYVLVRIKAGRLITPLCVETAFGGAHWMYTTTLETGLTITDFYFESAETAITTTRSDSEIVPNPADYTENQRKWFYDQSTGEFQFYSDFQVWLDTFGIIEYALHFTNFRGRYFRSTPDTMEFTDPKVFWEPRLFDDVEVEFTQQNNLQGLLSISTSSLQLKNQDLSLNSYFTEYDCFNNREVKAWRGKGETFQFLFQGTIRAAVVNDETAEFSVDDMLSVLDKTYEDADLNIFNSISTQMHSKDILRTIPRTFGKVGPWDSINYWFSGFPGVTVPRLYGASGKMPEAACTNYNPALSTSVNRPWSCGFGTAPSTAAWKVSAHISTPFFGGTASRLAMDLTDAATKGITDMRDLFAVGDTIKQGTQYGIIGHVTTSSVYIWPYNASLTTADITRSNVALVIERSGIQYFPVSIRDYASSVGGNGDFQVTFVNNFEATVGLPSALDPATDRVYFRLWTDKDVSASKFIYEQFTTFGGGLTGLLSVPISGFAPDQVPAWPDPQLSFSIPFAGETDFPTYRDIFEKVLKSAMGFIYFDQTGAIRYKSFLDGIYEEPENVSGVDPEAALTKNNSSSFQIQFDLYDLYAGVRFNWGHNPALYNSESLFPNGELQAVKALYKTNKLYEVESLVSVNSPGATDFLLSFAKLVIGRTAIYSLVGFDDHFGVFIGDDIRVSRGKIIGETTSQMLRIISLGKGLGSVSMRFSDLKRFPTL